MEINTHPEVIGLVRMYNENHPDQAELIIGSPEWEGFLDDLGFDDNAEISDVLNTLASTLI